MSAKQMKTFAFGLALLIAAGASAAASDTTGSAAPSRSAAKKTAPAKKAPKPDAKNKQVPTDSQIRKILIQASIDEYPGNCPCPYNVASNGSSCGGRSAWSRAGGYSPLCYPKDVSDEMVQQYRNEHPAEGEEKSAER